MFRRSQMCEREMSDYERGLVEGFSSRVVFGYAQGARF
jgi:hypothetical protein